MSKRKNKQKNEALEAIQEKEQKRKKKENPWKREFGIELIHGENYQKTCLYKVSADIGFRTAGLTWLDLSIGRLECLYYKKNKECQVQGMKIVNLLNLCKETIQDYISLLPDVIKENLDRTQFIFEEPLIIAGQRSFSISLYILLSQLIEHFIYDLKVHSVVLVVPGSAKKLLGFKSNVHMPDKEKTKFVKENLPEVNCTNNHQADSVFSMILTNQEFLKEKYLSLKVLKDIEYRVYESSLTQEKGEF